MEVKGTYDKILEFRDNTLNCFFTGKIFVTKPVETSGERWIIGPYSELKGFATNLRNDKHGMIETLGANRTVFGLRETDKAPKGAQETGGYKKLIKGKTPDKSTEELKNEFEKQRVNDLNKEFKARLSDQFQEAREWYANKTLESHHIVEKDILNAINANIGYLKDENAPCVLIMAELHRRLINKVMGTERKKYYKNMPQPQNELLNTFQNLYSGDKMAEIRKIAETIIESIKP